MADFCKVLIVEDDKEINNLLVQLLRENGYSPSVAFTGLEALDILKNNHFDLVLLDILLPFKSGDEVLKSIREVSSMPVIMLTAKDMTQTKVDLLRLGADDYITKPFDIDELLARVEVALRHGKEKPQKLSHAGIVLDTIAKSVSVEDSAVTLTAKEYQILELMMRHPRKVFSKANLFESVWGEEYLGDENTLNVHISNLRKKLKSVGKDTEYIETLWGLGYQLVQED